MTLGWVVPCFTHTCVCFHRKAAFLLHFRACQGAPSGGTRCERAQSPWNPAGHHPRLSQGPEPGGAGRVPAPAQPGAQGAVPLVWRESCWNPAPGVQVMAPDGLELLLQRQ